MTTDVGERNPETIEEAAILSRDLIDQATQVMGAARGATEDNWEIVDASPRRRLWVLYSMVDGTRVEVPEWIGKEAIKQRVRLRGKTFYAWTDSEEKAPKYVKGKVLCFLHPDAPERDMLDELGIPPKCEANELRNLGAKRIHGQRLHKGDWDAYQEALGIQRQEAAMEQQRQQTAATLQLAAAATAKPATKAT